MPRQAPKQQSQPKVLFPGPNTLRAIQIVLSICDGSITSKNGGLDARLAEAVVQELRALPASQSDEQALLKPPSKKSIAGLLALYGVVLRWCLDDRNIGLQPSSTSFSASQTFQIHGGSSRTQGSSASLVRPPAVMCLLLRRHLAAYITWLVNFSRPRFSAVASIPSRPTAASVAVGTALLRCGTLQCYARLLSAAQTRLVTERDLWRATDAVMVESRALLLESSSLMRALAAVSEAVAGTCQRANAPSPIHHPPAAAANCPRSPEHPEADRTAPTAGACSPASSPSVPTPTALEVAPSSSSPAPCPLSSLPPSLPDLLLTQMDESSVLSHLARLLMLCVKVGWVQEDDLHLLRDDIVATMDSLGAVLSSLACCSSPRGQAAQGPYPAMLGLISGAATQFLLLSHTMSVCSAAGVTGDGNSAPKDAVQDHRDEAVSTAAASRPHSMTEASQLLVSRLPLWDEQGKVIVPSTHESQQSAAPTGARGKLADRLAARRQRQGQRGAPVSVSAAADVAMHSAPDLAPAPRFVSLRLVHQGLLLLQAEVEEWRHRPPVTEDTDPRVGVGVELMRRSSSKPADDAAAGSSGGAAGPRMERVLERSGVSAGLSLGSKAEETSSQPDKDLHIGEWILQVEMRAWRSLLDRLRKTLKLYNQYSQDLTVAFDRELTEQTFAVSLELYEKLRREYDQQGVLPTGLVQPGRRPVCSVDDVLAKAEAENAAQSVGSKENTSLGLTPAQRQLVCMPEGGWPVLLRQWVGEMRDRKDNLMMELRAQLEPEMQRLVLAAIERGLQQQQGQEEEGSQPADGCQQEGPQPESELKKYQQREALQMYVYELAAEVLEQRVDDMSEVLTKPMFAHLAKLCSAIDRMDDEVIPRTVAAGRLPRFHLALHQYCLRIAQMVRAQWQVAAAGAPPSGAGAGARPPGSDVAAAPPVVFRNGPLSSVTLLALRIAKDDVLHRLEAVAGGGVLVAVADALQSRLAEWWSAACGVLSSAAAAVEAGQEWQRGNCGGGGGNAEGSGEEGIAVEALCGLLAVQAASAVELTGPVGGAAGCCSSSPHATHPSPTEQTGRSETTHSETSFTAATRPQTASSCQQAHAISGPETFPEISTPTQAYPGSCSDSQHMQSPPAGRPGHDVAAALAAGVIPCATTLLRHLAAAPPPVHYRQQHQQGPPADLICPAHALAAVLQPLLGDDVARRQLLSHGDTGQVAALADNVAEMLRRLQSGAERWAAEQRRRGQQEGAEKAEVPMWLLDALAGLTAACLLVGVEGAKDDKVLWAEGVAVTTASSGDGTQGSGNSNSSGRGSGDVHNSSASEDAGGDGECGHYRKSTRTELTSLQSGTTATTAAAAGAAPAGSDSPELTRLRMALSCIHHRLTPAVCGAVDAFAECVKPGYICCLGFQESLGWISLLARCARLRERVGSLLAT